VCSSSRAHGALGWADTSRPGPSSCVALHSAASGELVGVGGHGGRQSSGGMAVASRAVRSRIEPAKAPASQGLAPDDAARHGTSALMVFEGVEPLLPWDKAVAAAHQMAIRVWAGR